MSNSAADLWPSDLVPQELITPYEIMSAQAHALNNRMNGLVAAEVKSVAVDDNIDPRLSLRFEIFSAPQTCRVKLFEAAHRIDFSYPVVLHGPGRLPPFLREKYYQPSMKDLIQSATMSKMLQAEGKWVENEGIICATPQEFTLKLRELLASAEIKIGGYGDAKTASKFGTYLVTRLRHHGIYNLIIEGLLTTISDKGEPHVAPMGPVVDAGLSEWILRPFASSTTFKLLRERSTAVFHVVDDVLPVVQAVLRMPVEVEYEQLASGSWIIADCCHWFQLQVVDWDVSSARSEAKARVIDRGVKRPFWGWNRAKHAVLEATILATRLHLADRHSIADDLATLKKAVEKTAGEREWAAWNLVEEFIDRSV